MGSVLYDFLADSLLLDGKSLKEAYANEPDGRIEKELTDYREFCIRNIDTLRNEIEANASSLSVFTSSSDTPIPLLKQTALYINQFVVSDPLFHYTNFESSMEKAMSSQLGFPDNGINRGSIAKAALYLKMITPMVTANFVKVFPLDLFFERPGELPLTMPVNNNNNLLPPDILDFFKTRAQLANMERFKDGGWAIMPGGDLKLGRAINVEFEGSMYDGGMLYFLTQIDDVKIDEAAGSMTYRQTFPDTPPSNEEFENWVIQSVNSAARAFYDRTFSELRISTVLNSSYIAKNELTSDLISRNFGQRGSIPDYTAQQMLNVDLPFLEKIDIERLMQVRENDADVFTSFRLELEKQFRELRSVTDPKILKQKAENIFHELNEVQVQKINRKINHIHKQIFVNSAIAIGGLVGTIPTGGYSLAGTAIALAKGYKDYNEYIEKVREHPAYFLWKLKTGKK